MPRFASAFLLCPACLAALCPLFASILQLLLLRFSFAVQVGGTPVAVLEGISKWPAVVKKRLNHPLILKNKMLSDISHCLAGETSIPANTAGHSKKPSNFFSFGAKTCNCHHFPFSGPPTPGRMLDGTPGKVRTNAPPPHGPGHPFPPPTLRRQTF